MKLKKIATKLSITIKLYTNEGCAVELEKVADLTRGLPFKQVTRKAILELVEDINRMGILATELNDDKKLVN